MGEIGGGRGDAMLEEIDKDTDELARFDLGDVRWKGFLPRMFLRVLLVEGDDSTRQIVAALLKKCNYEVAAVADGLKAWEMLKEKPCSVDLILAEVQLPSISGFCLLNMIMGHESCKNIPVIMMSMQDSVSVVFKCMMKGAADFLVKPIRRNELINLWQHVWRRETLSHQSSGSKHWCHDRKLLEGKDGATSENNSASNHSSDNMDCGQKKKNFSEKGSDALSSCTKPDMEAESTCLSNMGDILQPKFDLSPAIDSNVNKFEEHVKLGVAVQIHESKAEGDEAVVPTSCGIETDYSEKQVRYEPSNEAFDLIGTMENQQRSSYQHTNDNFVRDESSVGAIFLPEKINGMYKFNSAPLLELSLKRSDPTGNEETEERHTLNHSNASAFSRYNNRSGQQTFSSSVSFTEPQPCTSSTLKLPTNQASGNSVDALQCKQSVQSIAKEGNAVVVDPSSPDKMIFSCPQLGMTPVTLPFGGMPPDGLCAGYGSLFQPMFCTHQSVPPGPPPWITDSKNLQQSLPMDSSHQSSTQINKHDKKYQPCDQNAEGCGYNSGTTQDNLESLGDKKCVLSAPDQTGSSSFCNSNQCHIKSSGSRSICNGINKNVSNGGVAAPTSESGNNECVFTGDPTKGLGSQRASQREIALNKFRLKRKDRCYEKKVRYQSRKRLAEQRPRVKGQFVRRVQSDSHQPELET